MITKNISRQLTTGTLAIAGSVAALSFAGAAQAASMIAVTGTATASSWGTTNPILTPGAPTGLSGTPTGDFAGLNYTAVSGIKPITILGTPPVTSPAIFTFNTGGLISSFAQIALGSGVTVSITPTAASGMFVSMPGMSSTNYLVAGSAFFDVLSGPDFIGLFNLSVASVGAGWTYTLSFEKSGTQVPEPSAILGILAVAGVGAFARRKS